MKKKIMIFGCGYHGRAVYRKINKKIRFKLLYDKNRSLQKKIKLELLNIDNFGINGDFVESQAFAYLAIRSFLKLPISFPDTTGCKEPITGGEIVKNF